MKIGICVNKHRDFECATALKFIDCATKKGLQVFVASGVEEFIKLPSYSLDDVAKKSDIMVVFGGDGTMLSVARRVVKYEIPLLGVNKGNLGFLTECEDTGFDSLVTRLINNDFRIEKRSMLKADVCGEEYLALNEISLSRGMSSRTIDISITVDGGLCDIVTGDGVIISTPTGSTAYAMSCGGAILSPSVRAIGVTAICPHSLNSRPMVVGDESKILLHTQCNSVNDIMVCVDGENVTLKDCDNLEVLVEKSDFYTQLIRLNDSNFYSKLIQKMFGWNKLG